jgi:hypothetical protein
MTITMVTTMTTIRRTAMKPLAISSKMVLATTILSPAPSTAPESGTEMYRKFSTLLAIALCAILYCASPVSAQPSLGSAQSFGVLGASTVTNTGATTVTLDVGVSPGTAITGFPPGVVVGGAIHGGDAAAAQAQTDVTSAWNAVTGTPCTSDLTGQDLGGKTLTPGVYCFSSSAGMTGTLTLDFQNDPNAVFLFKTGSTLITASASSVALINNGGATCPPNLYWQVGSSATLGTYTTFAGNIMALASITLTTGARVNGRALARTGAVTMDTNTVTACPPPAPPASVSTITIVGASASGVYPPGTTYGGVPITALNLASGVEVGPTGTALGELSVTLIGNVLGVERDIHVDAEANAGSRSQANVTIFSGTCTIDLGDGTPPLPGVSFSATITSDGSGLGSLALALGATTLPVANINGGTIVLRYR